MDKTASTPDTCPPRYGFNQVRSVFIQSGAALPPAGSAGGSGGRAPGGGVTAGQSASGAQLPTYPDPAGALGERTASRVGQPGHQPGRNVGSSS
jgi:hypothetical protein